MFRCNNSLVSGLYAEVELRALTVCCKDNSSVCICTYLDWTNKAVKGCLTVKLDKLPRMWAFVCNPKWTIYSSNSANRNLEQITNKKQSLCCREVNIYCSTWILVEKYTPSRKSRREECRCGQMRIDSLCCCRGFDLWGENSFSLQLQKFRTRVPHPFSLLLLWLYHKFILASDMNQWLFRFTSHCSTYSTRPQASLIAFHLLPFTSTTLKSVGPVNVCSRIVYEFPSRHIRHRSTMSWGRTHVCPSAHQDSQQQKAALLTAQAQRNDVMTNAHQQKSVLKNWQLYILPVVIWWIIGLRIPSKTDKTTEWNRAYIHITGSYNHFFHIFRPCLVSISNHTFEYKLNTKEYDKCEIRGLLSY